MTTISTNTVSAPVVRLADKVAENTSPLKLEDLQGTAAEVRAVPAPLQSLPQLLHFQMEFLKMAPTDTDAGEYAAVYRGGEKIGSISNTGSTSLPFMFPDPDGGPKEGPELAQWRAGKLADMGYQVRKSETAIPREQWDSWKRPSFSQEALDAYVRGRFAGLSEAATAASRQSAANALS
jgi:hypothetical protein